MKKYYFTFGFGQVHQGCFIVIEAENSNDARETMVRKFDTKWAMQYTKEQWFRNGTSQQEEFNLKEIN